MAPFGNCLLIAVYGSKINCRRVTPELPSVRTKPPACVVGLMVSADLRARKARGGYWLLQDAKARFSELVRKVRSEGPQHVTVHGRDEVVVIAADEFRRLTGNVTGLALIEAMQASPYREVELEPGRGPMPVRDVSL